MTEGNETRRRKSRTLDELRRLNSLVLEAAELAGRMMQFMLMIVLFAFYAVILVTNFLNSACMLAACFPGRSPVWRDFSGTSVC
jgi:hypothetical protein